MIDGIVKGSMVKIINWKIRVFHRVDELKKMPVIGWTFITMCIMVRGCS